MRYMLFHVAISGLLILPVPAATAQGRRIIDMHLHAQALWGQPGRVDPRTGIRTPLTTEEVQARTLSLLDSLGIVLAVTSGPRAEQYKQARPSRILVSPLLFGVDTPVDSLRSWHRSGRLQVLAEFAPQYAGLPPNAPELDPYFALAEELDIPVGLHVGLGPVGAAYRGSPRFRIAHGNPLLLEDVLIRRPKLRLYVMHAGWPFLDEMIALLHAHPQVYIDVAVINWYIPRAEFHHYLRRLIDAGFADRIMFGSDQMIFPDAIRVAVEAIESAAFLTDKQKEDIFFTNAVRFLRLSQTPTP